MASATLKVSAETRDRIRALGDGTLEDIIIRALDALEAQQFWTRAEAAQAAFDRLDRTERGRRAAAVAEVAERLDNRS